SGSRDYGGREGGGDEREGQYMICAIVDVTMRTDPCQIKAFLSPPCQLQTSVHHPTWTRELP
nr:hypothetical protein [Tanacetum cinerariifolium]